jgi:RNA polymerase sigma-70 factor (ECF subfamily)
MARAETTRMSGLATDVTIAPDGAITAHGRDVATIDFERILWPLYQPLVRRLVLVLGQEADAEDVAQEALMRAWSAWSTFDGKDARAWLYTIALRLAFNRLRSRRRWLRRVASGEGSSWNDSIDPDLLEALTALEPRMRSALLLNAIDGYTQREIALMLDVPEGTVASWIFRARRTVRGRVGMASESEGRSERQIHDPERES